MQVFCALNQWTFLLMSLCKAKIIHLLMPFSYSYYRAVLHCIVTTLPLKCLPLVNMLVLFCAYVELGALFKKLLFST